jgi:hypothetical protein
MANTYLCSIDYPYCTVRGFPEPRQFVLIISHTQTILTEPVNIVRTKIFLSDRLAIPLVTRLFSGEGKFENMGCDSTENRGQRQEKRL